MPKDLLLEIGLEEMPARYARGAMDELRENTLKWLEESRLAHAGVEAYATPRRLAVLVRNLADRQADASEEVRGPARRIAQDEQGNWTKAALGFARSQGVDPSELYFKDTGGAEYVFARKSTAGAATEELLPEALRGLVTSLSFPKNMRWGDCDLRYIRPIRWIVALYGRDVVPLEIAGVRSGNVTKGHRFLGGDAVIGEPSTYRDVLRGRHVIADAEERKAAILAGIERLSREKGWRIEVREDLLEEVLFLVEWPTVLAGSFDPEFLQIPQEVLITSMREHQRYFPVFDEAGRLLPHFVTVRNGDETSLDVVRRGNEKVLRARLADARFFYAEDLRLPIADALARLERIVYHEELGTMGDKVRRVRRIAGRLAERLGLDAQTAADVDRAAEICKFDLVTQMVYEFPELQGIMGEDYARHAGEREAVARAVNEHYAPRHAGDRPPASTVGAVVGIADKIDTIAGCFSIGIVPTGSQDPYALRRQAAGIVSTLLAHGFELRLDELFRLALDAHRERGLKRSEEEIERDLKEFFALRVRNVLTESGMRHDVIEAVLAAGADDVRRTLSRAKVLQDAVSESRREAFRPTSDALVRVCNLAVKADSRDIDEKLFSTEAERTLHGAWRQAHARFEEAVRDDRMEDALAALASMRDAVNGFFDAVLVMVDDEAVRRNRLALLASIADDIRAFADFSRLVI
ncbi:MAG: glycine--tRNA ligase subunit beta [Paenibacillaceae bacterium ZCTH02-B3]|nr:MAG: glycine--tRNA ligase subunit beta [Paenibacillaceae bacterium ZCTH02-B3]